VANAGAVDNGTRVSEVISLALDLGARSVPDWTTEEELLALRPGSALPLFEHMARQSIHAGRDPLGERFCQLLSGEQRRPFGATYTPKAVVNAMIKWAAERVEPTRVVDPGVGSARFLVEAGRQFPGAELVGIDVDPVATIMARGHLAAAGLAGRSRVILGDYRSVTLREVDGPTLFLGNPPYVRHHLIEPCWKRWLTDTARRLGYEASQLAGLHAHFFLATALQGRSGDYGVLVTAAEWLDVNYGRLVRELLLDTLGLTSVVVVEPTAEPFPGTQATAVITGFRIGSAEPTVAMRRVGSAHELGSLESDWRIGRDAADSLKSSTSRGIRGTWRAVPRSPGPSHWCQRHLDRDAEPV
jgi:adenine-specific DNA-methyltransferase